MKKSFKKVAVAGLALASSFGLVACKKSDNTKIGYEFINYDQEYSLNDNVSFNGTVLKIKYKNGSEKRVEVFDEMIKVWPDMTTPGRKTVIIEYQGVEYSFNIEVVSPTVVSSQITGYKTEYHLTEQFDISNLKLLLNFENETNVEVDVTSSMIVQMPNMNVPGKKTIKILYYGAEFSFDITVLDPILVKYEITGYNKKFKVNEAFDISNLKLLLDYDYGNDYQISVPESMIVKMPDMSTPGKKIVVIKHQDAEYPFEIEVEEQKVIGHFVFGLKDEYHINETFSVANLKLLIDYDYGVSEQISLTDNMITTAPNLSTAGRKTVVVTYNNKEFPFEIVVAPAKLVGHEITGYKTEYHINETFDISNLKLNLDYDYLEDVEVAVTSGMIKTMPNMASAGTKTVVVTYNNAEYSFEIVVAEAQLLAYEITGYKTEYHINEEFDISNLKLKLDYDYIEDVEVSITENMLKSMPNMATAGRKTVVVTYNNAEYSFEIVVGEAQVLSYEITGYKAEYHINETFDITDLKLNLDYDYITDEEVAITESMIVAMPNMASAGEKTVIVTYGGEEYSFKFIVAPAQLVGYEITGYKAEYHINETFDITDLKLKLDYDYTTDEEVSITENMIVAMPNMASAGTKTVVVTYNNAEYSFEFVVGEAQVLSCEITGYKTEYHINEEFDITDLKLKLDYDYITDEEVAVTENMIKAMPNMSTAGRKTVIVTYNNAEYSFEIVVAEAQLLDYAITGYKTEYHIGEEFDISNLKLKLDYDYIEDVEVSITENMLKSMPNMATAGRKTVVVTYNNAEYSFEIVVGEAQVLSYEITGYKAEYHINEEFDISNLKLNLDYDYITDEEVSITESMIKAMPNMASAGEKTVVVTYGGEEYSFKFIVTPAQLLDYAITGYKAEYHIGEEFNISNLKLNLDYDYIEDVEVAVTSGMIVAMPNMATAGRKTVVVTYNNADYSFEIVVAEAQLLGYEITGYKAEYHINETFDITDLKLNLDYDYITDEEISVSENMIKAMPNMASAGEKTVVVTYGGEEYSFKFIVTPAQLLGYEITGYKAEYHINETFDITDLKLNLDYDYITDEEVAITESMIVAMPNMATAGRKTVVVTYNNAEYSFEIYVQTAKLLGYNIVGKKDGYHVNEEFDLSNLKLVLDYDYVEDVEIQLNQSMLKIEPDMTTSGRKAVVFSYSGVEYSFIINVESVKLVSYEVIGCKDSYHINETFDITNLKLILEYDYAADKEISLTSGMIKTMPSTETAGRKTGIVVYDGVEYPFAIIVEEAKLLGYEIIGFKEEYRLEEAFDISDLKLKLDYDYVEDVEVEVTASMIVAMPDMATAGEKTVVVNFNGEDYSFQIEVVAPQLVSYSIAGFKNEYHLNEKFDIENLTLSLVYTYGGDSEVVVTEDMLIKKPETSKPGLQTGVVKYNNVEYPFEIAVAKPKVVSYEVTGHKSKYIVNENFDISELKVTIYYDYDDPMELDVTEEMLLELPDMTTEGTKELYITIEDTIFAFSFDVMESEKSEMLDKMQGFINDYNSLDIKSSAIKIAIDGNARYLEGNVEFNQTLADITMQSFKNLEGYKIYQRIIYEPYLLIKEFETIEESNNDTDYIEFIGMDNYLVLHVVNGEVVKTYGPGGHYLLSEDMTEISFEEFMDEALQITNNASYGKEIVVYSQAVAKSIYKAITNAIVDSSMDIQFKDILTADESLVANLDILKTIKNIGVNLSNVDFYNFIVNELILKEDDIVYVQDMMTFIKDNFYISDEESIQALEAALLRDMVRIRNNQFTESEKVYNMVIELNDIMQKSNGDPAQLERFDIVVSGIDKDDQHIISKLAYTFKDMAKIYYYEEFETLDFEETQGNDKSYTGWYKNEEGQTVYKYSVEAYPENAQELIDKYYQGVKMLIEALENKEEYENRKTMAYDVIAAARMVDEVVVEVLENQYYSNNINTQITTGIKELLEQYIQLYDAEVIADLIDLMAYALPEGASQHEVKTTSIIGNTAPNMSPYLDWGDTVTVKPQSVYSKEEVIRFNYQGMMYVSRIVGIFEENGVKYFVCHGDGDKSINPANAIYDYEYADDVAYIKSLIDAGKTKAEIEKLSDKNNKMMIITQGQIQGLVTGVNEMYLSLPANLVAMLQECADIIYFELASPNPNDYVKIVEQLCERLNLEKEYYIEKFYAGELHIFEELFDKSMNLEEFTGTEKEFYTALRNACIYLDRILLEGTNTTEVLDEIHKCFVTLNNLMDEQGEGNEQAQIITDIIAKLTNTQQDFYANLKDVVDGNKTVVKDLLVSVLTDLFGIYENEEAITELDQRVNYYLNAYLRDRFNVDDLFKDCNVFIDSYCEDDSKTISKSLMIFFALLNDKDGTTDYNEMFAELPLPNEIKEIDFNTLIRETLKDKETYDLLHITDLKVDYVTDEEGNIVKEILTISLNAEYDILFSELNSTFAITIEINF